MVALPGRRAEPGALIKLLNGGTGADPQAVARFVGEARAAVQIQNEHVARVSDVGALESGEPYIVMELLQGADLGDTLRQRGPLPVAEAVGWVLEASEAVAEAHAPTATTS